MSALFRISALLVVACVLFGQVASRISGTVRDSSGAVMSGVKVVATDVDRGTAVNTTTNDAGRYAFQRQYWVAPAVSQATTAVGRTSPRGVTRR